MTAGAGLVALVFLDLLVSGPVSTQHIAAVSQPSEISVERGSSVNVNCTFSVKLHHQKPSLTWVKKEWNGEEAKIYPVNPSAKQVQIHVDSEVFKTQSNAGILLKELRRRDSGIYFCCITVLKNGMPSEYRGQGTRLTVTVTMLDRLIPCCPVGVFIAALLVLHIMVYKKWVDLQETEIQHSEPLEGPNTRVEMQRFPRSLKFLDCLPSF